MEVLDRLLERAVVVRVRGQFEKVGLIERVHSGELEALGGHVEGLLEGTRHYADLVGTQLVDDSSILCTFTF